MSHSTVSVDVTSSRAQPSLVSSSNLGTPVATQPSPNSGTASEAALAHRASSGRTPDPLSAVEAVQLECEELRARTVVQCDEMTDFQRIVSHRTAERHGVWSFALGASEPHQYFCDHCGHQVTVTHTARRGLAEPVPFELHGATLTTPFCSDAERRSFEGCLYTREALDVLKQRATFDQDTATLLKRLRTASRSIHDSVV